MFQARILDGVVKKMSFESLSCFFFSLWTEARARKIPMDRLNHRSHGVNETPRIY